MYVVCARIPQVLATVIIINKLKTKIHVKDDSHWTMICWSWSKHETKCASVLAREEVYAGFDNYRSYG